MIGGKDWNIYIVVRKQLLRIRTGSLRHNTEPGFVRKLFKKLHCAIWQSCFGESCVRSDPRFSPERLNCTRKNEGLVEVKEHSPVFNFIGHHPKISFWPKTRPKWARRENARGELWILP